MGFLVHLYGVTSVMVLFFLRLPWESSRLIKIVPTQMSDETISIHAAPREFSPKLDWGSGLASDNWTHMGLSDTHEPIVNPMTPMFIHPPLLSIHLADHQQCSVTLFTQS